MPFNKPLLICWHGCDERLRQPRTRPAQLMEVSMNQQDISKLCADSLRTSVNEKYNIKLQASHAHELVAAYFGYRSRNAMLADKLHPIDDLSNVEIVVLTPDEFIDERRRSLEGLSNNLPDSYVLGEAVYTPLFDDKYWASKYPPFRSFKALAQFLIENNDTYQNIFRFYKNIPMDHTAHIQEETNVVTLNIVHTYKSSTGEQLGAGQTTIVLPRKFGRTCFGKPQMSIERWTGDARKSFTKFYGDRNV